MTKRTGILVTLFLAAYGIIVLLVKSSSIPDTVKLLVIAGHTVLYLSVIFAEVALFRQHFGAAGEWIRSLSNVGRAGKKREIYQAMGNALGYTVDHAYVTYFNKKGPEESKNRAEKQYHSQLSKAITEGESRNFRRIIALDCVGDTPAKRAWVRAEMELAAEHDNYKIKFIEFTREVDLPLNVQIFDNFVFLIDPSRENEDTLPRDIHFLSEEIAGIWFRYYRFIWESRATEELPASYK